MKKKLALAALVLGAAALTGYRRVTVRHAFCCGVCGPLMPE